MKKISAVLVLSLMSTVAFAESDNFQYANYKEMFIHDTDTGSYSFTANCTDNTLQWNKKEKKYTREILKTISKGVDIVQRDGDSIKTTSSSVDSNGMKYFSESETTFLSENTYIRHNKYKNVDSDGTEFKTIRVIEGEYIDGTYNTTKIITNGVETPVKKSTYISVTDDNQFNSFYDAYTYEPANIKEQMQDSTIESLTLKVDTVCTTQYTKI